MASICQSTPDGGTAVSPQRVEMVATCRISTFLVLHLKLGPFDWQEPLQNVDTNMAHLVKSSEPKVLVLYV